MARIAKRPEKSGRGFGRAALLSVLALLAMGAVAGVAPSEAQARAGCPAPYLVHSPGVYGSEELERARDDVFRVHIRNVRLEPPVRWSRDPYDSRRFRGALHSFGWLDVLFYDYRENDRLASLRTARDLALDWIESNPPGSRRGDRTWDDRVTATRATYLAYVLRASGCEGLLNERKRRTLSAAVRHHGNLAASKELYRPTNHGLFVDTNLILLNRQVPNIAEGRGWGRTGKRRFGRTLRGRIFEQEGFWLEHSANYQLAIRRELGFFRDLVGGGAYEPLYERMTDVSGWLVQPDEKLTLLGSSIHKKVPDEVKDEAANDDGLLWLGRSGLAVVKGPGSYLSLAATFFNGSHKDSDDLSVDLYDAGRRILSDSGEYDKDDGRWGTFSDSPQAHTTLTVDGGGFSRNAERSYGSGLLGHGLGDGWHALAGHNPLVRRTGARHDRFVLFRPGLGLILIDRVRAQRRHVYRRYIQLGSSLEASSDSGGLQLESGGWDGRLADATQGGDPRLHVAEGRRQPSILGFEFPRFRERVERPTAVMTTQGSDLDHVAVLSLDDAQPLEAELRRAGRRVVVVDLEVAGSPAGTLEARRSGEHIDVTLGP